MRMYDVIYKKRNGEVLTDEEIAFFVEGYTRGEIPDYQASALLMALFFSGVNEHETATLTMEMAKSGDIVDLSSIHGIKVDKHSTGGVGDKTSLIVGPIVAACGVSVAKMSGRGLGHTGGTVDKLEAIPNLRTVISEEEFLEIVQNVGISIIGQSGNIAPADKKLYALRDVTATVDNISLIASSIMSKKLAAGSDAILLDVKTGSGAFISDFDGSVSLAKEMVAIGENNGKRMMALITDMNAPLGNAIGNSLEIIEVVKVLKSCGPRDLTEVSLTLAENMLYLAGKGELPECRRLAEEALTSEKAFSKLCEMAAAQGGDVSVLEDTSRFEQAPCSLQLKSKSSGYIAEINALTCGKASVLLGAGRATIDDSIDFSAGIILAKKPGDTVKDGEVLAELFAADEAKLQAGAELLESAFKLSEEQPSEQKLILAKVTQKGVETL